MSEVHLSVLTETGKDNMETKSLTTMQEVNEALKACTFGRFHIRLLFSSFFGMMANILVTNSTAYILPNAECDLRMDLVQKGLVSAIPFLGTLLSAVIAGFLTDAFGRKTFLVGGYGLLFISILFEGSSQSYKVLVTVKFFQGFLFGATLNPTITLTSEYQFNDIRDRVMLFQSSYAAVAQILIALYAWGVLTQEWKITMFSGYIVLNTWNFFLYFGALWPLGALIMYIFIPESPKYLITQKRYDEARKILIGVYKENTGLSEETYPYANLWKDKTSAVAKAFEKRNEKTLVHRLVIGLHNAKSLFRRPLVFNMALVCILVFCSVTLHNILKLWFPEISTIDEYYSVSDVGKTNSLCDLLDEYTYEKALIIKNTTKSEKVCTPAKSGTQTYINNVIFGSVCLLPYFLYALLVNKVGKKYLILFSGLINISCTIALRWVITDTGIVILFLLDAAVFQTSMGLYQAFVVEHFPTSTRSLTISLIMIVGRIGTIGSNILLSMRCAVPFFTFGGLIMCVTIFSIFLPNKKRVQKN